MDKEPKLMHGPHDGVERATFRMPVPADELRQAKPNYWKAERLARNIQAEGEAIKEYMELLSSLDPQEDAGTIKAINDIVAEEKKHIIILQKILVAYDCVKPEMDGMPGHGKPQGK